MAHKNFSRKNFVQRKSQRSCGPVVLSGAKHLTVLVRIGGKLITCWKLNLAHFIRDVAASSGNSAGRADMLNGATTVPRAPSRARWMIWN